MSSAEQKELAGSIRDEVSKIIGRWALGIIAPLFAIAFTLGIKWTEIQTTLHQHDLRINALERPIAAVKK
jgi:hypothetical protein